MTALAVLRGAALTMAVLGVIDPGWTMNRQAPVAVDVRATSRPADARAQQVIADVQHRLASALGARVTMNAGRDPAAIILVGSHATARAVPETTIPVSTVGLSSHESSGVRIVSARSPAPVPLGWAAIFEATIEAVGRRGKTSRIVLTQGEAELAHVEHTWTSDRERFDARLPYAPASEGSSRVRLRVDDEACNASCRAACPEPCPRVDLRAAAIGRRLKVLAHEPRPSWATAFVRRVLEEEAMFDVASLVRSSRALSVRGGSPPPALTAEALMAFDVVLVGAPEELRSAEVEALRSFARRRGGTVVLLPDRRPSGPYLQLMPAGGFDEMLVDAPLELKTTDGATFHASELAVPRDTGHAMETLASQKDAKPVVVSWPAGIGTIVFSGALDAWRYRATTDEGFARFWRSRVADAALAAPPRLHVSLSPEIVRPGEEVTVRARLRPTELVEASSHTSVPPIRAIAIGQGTQDAIRLWPTAEAGSFEGRLRAPAAGTIDVQVTAENGAVGDDILTVAEDASHPDGDGRAALELVASATGGVSVNTADLGPLEQWLRGLPVGAASETLHPTRSIWFVITFVALACSEWGLRRRRGLL